MSTFLSLILLLQGDGVQSMGLVYGSLIDVMSYILQFFLLFS
jgi:hypothetical protein